MASYTVSRKNPRGRPKGHRSGCGCFACKRNPGAMRALYSGAWAGYHTYKARRHGRKAAHYMAMNPRRRRYRRNPDRRRGGGGGGLFSGGMTWVLIGGAIFLAYKSGIFGGAGGLFTNMSHPPQRDAATGLTRYWNPATNSYQYYDPQTRAYSAVPTPALLSNAALQLAAPLATSVLGQVGGWLSNLFQGGAVNPGATAPNSGGGSGGGVGTTLPGLGSGGGFSLPSLPALPSLTLGDWGAPDFELPGFEVPDLQLAWEAPAEIDWGLA